MKGTGINMKVCKHCGAIQSDNHSNCIDCGEKLGLPLSKQEEIEQERRIAKKINKLSNRKDYFYVSKADRVVAFLLLVCVIIFPLIRIMGGPNLEEVDSFFTMFAAILAVIAAACLVIPQIPWELYKFKFMFIVDNPDDMQPTELALYMRRFYPYALCTAAYIYLISIVVRYLIM